jgi:hypothetical protein
MSSNNAGNIGLTGGETGSTSTLPQVLWSSPEENLWVANRNGEYAGMVEFVDGHFLSRDNTNALLGIEVSLRDAKAAVRTQREPGAGLFDVMQLTLHRVGHSLSVTLPKRSPHYSRGV